MYIVNKEKEEEMLEGRLREVLKAIVEEYVRTNEPVGSVSLINNEKYDLDVSSATIVMIWLY